MKRSWTHQKHSLEQRTAEVGELHNTYREQDTHSLLRTLLALRERKDALEAQLQVNSEHIEAVNGVLTDRWDKEGVSSVKLDGQTFALKHKLYVSQANKEVFHEWLKLNGHADVIQPTVHPKTAEGLIRELMESGQRMVFDEMGVNVSFKQVIA